MKRFSKILIIIILIIFISHPVYAYSIRRHLINMGKNLVEFTFSPFYGVFVKGPQNVKRAYVYEVWERERPEKRGLLRYRLFAIWRTPGEETKGIVDGLVGSVEASGGFLKEFLSIFFSD